MGAEATEKAWDSEMNYLGLAGTLALVYVDSQFLDRDLGPVLRSMVMPKLKPAAPHQNPSPKMKFHFLPLGRPGVVLPGIHNRPSELPSPVANHVHQRLVGTTAVQRRSHFETSDMAGSFLIGDISQYKIYLVELPPNTTAPRVEGKKVYFLLMGNCYGLPEAPPVLYKK